MQSAVDKERNFEQAAAEIVNKMNTNPGSITSEVCIINREQTAKAVD